MKGICIYIYRNSIYYWFNTCHPDKFNLLIFSKVPGENDLRDSAMKDAANAERSSKLSPSFIPSDHTPILLNPKNGNNNYQNVINIYSPVAIICNNHFL